MLPTAVTKPLRRDGFTFKHFFVAHDRCAMKVGTDGVLLGAWAPLIEAGRALDIGTGSGLVALMLAQRMHGAIPIDAIELDSDACRQARDNFTASPWAMSLCAVEDDICAYAGRTSRRYQAIVSNPPYFDAGPACATPARARARYTQSLSHQALLTAATALLDKDGTLALILPYAAGEALIARALAQGWWLQRRTDVSDRAELRPHRLLLALTRRPVALIHDTLTLRDPTGEGSPAFRTLAGDFYLAF